MEFIKKGQNSLFTESFGPFSLAMNQNRALPCQNGSMNQNQGLLHLF
jgi:hypothetical protein